jgi:hypothetical protein
MKTVKQAAENNTSIEVKEGGPQDALFINREGMKQLLNRTFELGVEFAQRWYSFMSDELPQIGVEIIVKNKDLKNIVTPTSHGSIHYLSEKYTHWRPIELK